MSFRNPFALCSTLLRLAGTLALQVAIIATCHAQTVVGQWDVLASSPEAGEEEGVTQWVSPQGTILEFSDWIFEAGALRSEGGMESLGLWPEVETTSNKTVRAGVMLVKPAAPPNVKTTLFTGHHVARMANFPNGGQRGKWDALGPAAGVRVWVNGAEAAPLQNEGWQIVSFVAPSEMPLVRARIFADNYTQWARFFDGEAKVVILISGDSGEISEAALRGMESALALRHGVKGIKSATEQERNAARAVSGWSSFNVWSSLFLVR